MSMATATATYLVFRRRNDEHDSAVEPLYAVSSITIPAIATGEGR